MNREQIETLLRIERTMRLAQFGWMSIVTVSFCMLIFVRDPKVLIINAFFFGFSICASVALNMLRENAKSMRMMMAIVADSETIIQSMADRAGIAVINMGSGVPHEMTKH